MIREAACGVLALCLAAVYFAAASDLPVSLLSDEVGADGVPKALAVVLAVLGGLQLARAAMQRKIAGPDELAEGGLATHLRAFGMIVIGVVYIAVAPHLGYPLAVTALIFTVAVYAGMPLSPVLGVISVGGGIVMWLMFVKILGVAMPVGVFGRFLG